MPNTKITGDRVKTHWQYSKMIYFFGTVAAVMLAALIFTIATNRTPPNQYAVGIALVRSYSNTEKLEEDSVVLLERGQAYDQTLQSVSFMSIMYDGTDTNDGGAGAQMYMLHLSVGENDIFIQTEEMTKNLIRQGACLPLEEMDAFEEFLKRCPDAPVLWDYEPKPDMANDGEEEILHDPDEPKHAYALDISGLTGFIERQAMDNRGMYACIIGSSANPDTSMYVIGQMFDLFAPAPAEETEGAES